MRAFLLVLIAAGCGDPDDPPLFDPEDFEEGPAALGCEAVEGAFRAVDVDVEALDGEGAEDLDGAELTLVLAPGGGFTALLRDGDVVVTEGAWRVEDDRLVIDPFVPSMAGPATFECQLDDAALRLYGATTWTFADGEPRDAQILGDLVRVP